MSKTFKGKVVWITGGASGIGAACCTHFAEQGAQVVCTDIQTKMGEALQKKLAGAGHQVAFYEQDVTSETALDRAGGDGSSRLRQTACAGQQCRHW